MTPNHPFYSDGRWRAIGELAVESPLFAIEPAAHQSSPRRLVAFEPTGRTGPVFSLNGSTRS